jgi:DNA-binding transcriptional MerR regulator
MTSSSEGQPGRYSIDVLAELSGVSTSAVLTYHEHGMLPTPDGTHFDDESLRALRQLEQLRSNHQMDLAGLKLMVSLMDEVERLRAALRSQR